MLSTAGHCDQSSAAMEGFSSGSFYTKSPSQEPILPAKLFHTSDCRKRRYLISREIAKAVTAKTDCCNCLEFFVVEPAESNGNVVAPGLVTIHDDCTLRRSRADADGRRDVRGKKTNLTRPNPVSTAWQVEQACRGPSYAEPPFFVNTAIAAQELYMHCRDVAVKVLGYPPAAKLLELFIHEPVKGSVDSGDKGSAAGA